MGGLLVPEYDADEIAAWAASAPLTEGVLTPFGQVDPAWLSQDGTISMALGLERTKNWADAQLLRHLAERAANPEPVPFAPTARHHHYALMSLEQEIACALRWSHGYAVERIHAATVLVTQLPATLALMESGGLSYLHARSLVTAVTRLTNPTPALVRKLEERVLKRATERTVSEFRADIRRALAALDPAGAEEKQRAAAEERRVCYEPADDAMAWLNCYLPAAKAARMARGAWSPPDQLRRLAQDGKDKDARCRKQVGRVMLTFSSGVSVSGVLPVTSKEDLIHNETTDLTAGQQRDQGQATRTAGQQRSGGQGVPQRSVDGPGPPSEARGGCDVWHTLTAADRSTAASRGLIARDRTCRGPGCHRSARRCDLDHEDDFAQVGETNAESLTPKCERNHYTKQFTGWDAHRQPDGTITWTSPTGRTYDKPPDPRPEDRTRPKTEPDDDPAPF